MLFLGKEDANPLNTKQKCGSMVTVREGGWVVCPECQRRKAANPNWRENRSLMRIAPDTEATALPVYCRKCQTEIKLNIAGGLSWESLSH